MARRTDKNRRKRTTQYVEDDFWAGNAAIADASPPAVEAICRTQPSKTGNINPYFWVG
jgi:hypothetical protein